VAMLINCVSKWIKRMNKKEEYEENENERIILK
jgi:hypothetical protein